MGGTGDGPVALRLTVPIGQECFLQSDPARLITDGELAEMRRRKAELLRLLVPAGEMELDEAINGPGVWPRVH